MLYGEGKRAFHRLQLEIIRMSNDQSIFAWGTCVEEENVRTGSILADDPSFFWLCSDMELMDHDQFIESLKEYIPAEELALIDQDHFDIFPITNRGIQIWMLLRPYRDSDIVFKAWLPCRNNSSGPPVMINLAVWNSNYYRYSLPVDELPTEGHLQFRQVYLRYQDTYHNVTFEIDDSAMTENGFTFCDLSPSELNGNKLALRTTDANPLGARVYGNSQESLHFAVTLGQCFGQSWVATHAIDFPISELPRFYKQELVKGPERAQSMAEMPSLSKRYGRLWVNHIHPPASPWIMRTSRVVWERSRIGVRIEVLRDSSFDIGLNEWRILHVEVSDFFVVYTLLRPFIRRESAVSMTLGVSCCAICHASVRIYYVWMVFRSNFLWHKKKHRWACMPLIHG